MQKVTLVMQSGAQLVFRCEDASLKKSFTTGGLASLTIKGIKGQNFLHINLDNVDAVLFEEE